MWVSECVCGLLRNAEFRTHIALFIRLIDSVWFVRNIYFMPFELDANSSKRVSKSFVSFRLIWFFLRFTMLFIKTIKIFVSFLFTATPLNGMKHLYHIHSITMHWKQQYFDNSFSRLRLNRPNWMANEHTRSNPYTNTHTHNHHALTHYHQCCAQI